LRATSTYHWLIIRQSFRNVLWGPVPSADKGMNIFYGLISKSDVWDSEYAQLTKTDQIGISIAYLDGCTKFIIAFEYIMLQHVSRLLYGFGLTRGQWSVLFAASYYLPVPRDQFIELAMIDADGEFQPHDISQALQECIARGWVTADGEGEASEQGKELRFLTSEPDEDGILLTPKGARLKNQVQKELLETVLLV
jgi:hypothetical protein